MKLGFAASFLAGIVATLPGVIAEGGNSSFGACWVHVEFMYLFYVPLWCTMLFCTAVLCYFVAKKFRARRKGQTQKLSMRQKLVRRMLVFTCVFVVQWVAVSVARGCMFAGRDVQTCAGTTVLILARICSNSIGLCDALVWYGPVSNHARRVGVPICELPMLWGAVCARWVARRSVSGDLIEMVGQDGEGACEADDGLTASDSCDAGGEAEANKAGAHGSSGANQAYVNPGVH
jgi:hypothetical protein